MSTRDPRRSGSDDRFDTIAAIVVPLAFAIPLGFWPIVHKSHPGKGGGPRVTGVDAVDDGVWVLGLALVLHAWHMPAYRRHPLLRRTLVGLGIVVAILGFLRRLF